MQPQIKNGLTMETKTLPANALPRLSGSVKDAINFGIWFLYEITYSQNLNAKYSLSTSRGEFLLTKEGDIISLIPESVGDDFKYLAKINFTGIPAAPVVNMPSL